MVQLLDLPNELLLEITDLSAPEGIEQFSLCSKEIYALTKAALVSHRYRKRWGTIDCTIPKNPREELVRSSHPLRFLADIAFDEVIADYTTSLILGDPTYEEAMSDEDREEWSALRDVDSRFERWISTTVTSCPYLDDDESDAWTEKILLGDRGPACAILITLLPNLRSMTITDHLTIETPLGFMVKQIADASSWGDRISPQSLGKLSEVETGGSDFEVMLGIYAPWVALPSMRSLRGYMVDGDSFRWPYPPQISGVTSIQYCYSTISARGFTELFKGIKALETVEYEGGGSTDYDDSGWEPTGIVAGLLLYAKGTLQKLDLTYSKSEDYPDNVQKYFLVSLDAFEVLEWVRLDVELLFKTDSDACDVVLTGGYVQEDGVDDYHYGYQAQPLVDILPASIEKLELVGVLSGKNTASLMARLPELKPKLVPKLKKIVFEGNWSLDKTMMTACKNVGIMLKHRNTSFTAHSLLSQHNQKLRNISVRGNKGTWAA